MYRWYIPRSLQLPPKSLPSDCLQQRWSLVQMLSRHSLRNGNPNIHHTNMHPTTEVCGGIA